MSFNMHGSYVLPECRYGQVFTQQIDA